VKNPDSSIESWKFSAQTVAELPKLYDAFKINLRRGVVSKVEILFRCAFAITCGAIFPVAATESSARKLAVAWSVLWLFWVGFSRVVTHILQNLIRVLFKREE
jgi:hypothetical protein